MLCPADKHQGDTLKMFPPSQAGWTVGFSAFQVAS